MIFWPISMINMSNYTTFEGLQKLLVKTYLPTRNLVEISEEIQRCVQRTSDSTNEYARRLQSLTNDWFEQIKVHHNTAATQKALHKEKEKEIIIIFKKGLQNA